MIIIYNCGGDNLTGPSAGSAQRMIADGWAYYEKGEYNNALAKFNSAKKLNPTHIEVLTGLGWTNFALNNLEQAVINFNSGLNKNPNSLDLLVGYSFALYESDNYSTDDGSLGWALKAVEIDSAGFDIDGEDYYFIHNSKVTAKELRKIMALGYFYLGEFEESYFQLINYLNGNTLDQASPAFSLELLKELNRICGK